jgi:hypothetical protein
MDSSSFLGTLCISGKIEIFSNYCYVINTYSEFFLRLAIGFYMLIFQPPVDFCSDENIQTIFGTKLEDFLNYRIDYNSISQTVEKVVKKIFFRVKMNTFEEMTNVLHVRSKLHSRYENSLSVFFTHYYEEMQF